MCTHTHWEHTHKQSLTHLKKIKGIFGRALHSQWKLKNSEQWKCVLLLFIPKQFNSGDSMIHYNLCRPTRSKLFLINKILHLKIIFIEGKKKKLKALHHLKKKIGSFLYIIYFGHCWLPLLFTQTTHRAIAIFPLNWGTGQATFDLRVITALCTGPRRAATPFGKGGVVHRKLINFV